jgi:hypothetical protein
MVWVSTAPSASAMVFDVPSVTVAMLYASCQAKMQDRSREAF